MTRIMHALVALAVAPLLQTGAPTNEFSPELMLKPKTIGRFLIPANQQAGESFEKVADPAGLNVVFYPTFKADTPATLRIENATLIEALDQLSAQTGNFWFPWSAKTIVVAPDNPNTRRVLEPLIAKTVYLGNNWQINYVNAIMNKLRVDYQLRGVFQNDDAKAFTIRDTADRVAIAEREIALISNAAMPRPTSSVLYYPQDGTDYMSISENGSIRKLVPSNRAHLQNVLTDSISIDRSDTGPAIYSDLVGRAGLNVVFAKNIKPNRIRLHLDKVGLLDALDLLALQSQTVWQPVNPTTIFVMDDTQQNRRDMEPRVVKILYFTDRDGNGALRNAQVATTRRNGVLNVLRTAGSLRSVVSSNEANVLVVKDSPLRVFMAEKFLIDLDKGGTRRAPVTLTTPTSSFLAENGWVLGTAAEARPKLDLKLRSNTNIALDQEPQAAYATLAELGGLKVQFDPGVATEPASPLNLNNVDILEALDLLSLQTGNFWQVIDEHTIRVSPATPAARNLRHPPQTRTFTPADSSEAGVGEMLNILRVVFQLRDASIVDKTTLQVTDIPETLDLVQVLIDTLGKPRGN